MNHDELHLLLYQRVKEIQPHLASLVHTFKDAGMNPDEINTEICFALIHEGYKMRDLLGGIEIKMEEES